MNEPYTATIYSGDEKFAIRLGSDVDELYTWMLIHVNGHFGDIHGEITDNKTQKTIKAFRKSPIE